MRTTVPSILLVALHGAIMSAEHSYTNESEVPYYGHSPPVYPTPVGNGSTNGAWARAYEKAKAVVSQMTVEEMANITHGWPGSCVGNTGAVPRLNIPPICMADGPAGIRGQEFVSAFPAGIHIAATWDRSLMYRYGRAIGAEYRGKGINVALGPVAGPLGRIARGGRNWEGLSNDPYLAGAGMGLITQGIQDSGSIACPKHFLVNEQEYRRMPSELGESISSNVDDRPLHELYVFPFMNALKAGAGSVMCSYNRVNNSYGCQNSKLLNGVLKTELGFEGFVVSDWSAQHSGVATANAGMDVVMPTADFWADKLVEAVNNGSVSRQRMDDMATRLLASWYYLGQDKEYPPPGIRTNTDSYPPGDVQEDHALLIRTIGAAGTVLVKNVNRTLPLKSPKFLTVFGYDATLPSVPWSNPDRWGGGYDVNFGWNTFNGTLITGGGSGSNTPPYVVSPFQALQERAVADGGMLRWDFYSENPPMPYADSEACLVFINAYASESYDRVSLTDRFSDNLVLNVARSCPNTIVVVHSTGIRVVDAWIEHPNVTAVIFGGLPGQESGHSLLDILYGDVSPSGRLPYTVAKNESDYGALLNSTVSFDAFPQDDFAEGLFIDYRAFDKDNIEPRFEFGFGLSYTTFEYSKLKVSSRGGVTPGLPDPNIPIVQGGHPQLWSPLIYVTCEITNTGDVSAPEVAQLYVGIPYADTPARQLRGFQRVPLEPGESMTVTFTLTRRDLSIWDVVAQQWRFVEGTYTIWVGASSRDLRLRSTFTI